MTVTEQAQAAQVEKLVREMISRPKILVGMDLHSRKVTMTVSDWVYGADPIVKRRFLDVSLDALESTYAHNVSKDSLTIIEASTSSFSVVRRLKAIGYRAVVVYSAILKGYFVQVGQAVCRRSTSHGMTRWARAKIASGKAYNKVCMAVANKSITCAWHILMGHPAPNRENEALYRKKIRDLGYELGEAGLKEMGHESNAAFVDSVVTPLYAHLPKSELQTNAK